MNDELNGVAFLIGSGLSAGIMEENLLLWVLNFPPPEVCEAGGGVKGIAIIKVSFVYL